MKAVTLKQLKDELTCKSAKELQELCLHLSKFKKENKELLTYLLFEQQHEDYYIETIKEEIDMLFKGINTNSYYYIRKGVRKILSLTKKYIRYSKKKETETELLLYFCKKMQEFTPSIKNSIQLQNIFNTQVRMIQKAIEKLHEDLQYDFTLELNNLIDA